MNTKLLRRIQKRILKQPDQFMMDGWACNTTACIGGWAIHFDMEHESLSETDLFCRPRNPERVAAEILLLPEDRSSKLFYADEWPMRFYRRWQTAKTPKQRAGIAADRIEHFIKTKGAD